jgi:hypothetical protein
MGRVGIVGNVGGKGAALGASSPWLRRRAKCSITWPALIVVAGQLGLAIRVIQDNEVEAQFEPAECFPSQLRQRVGVPCRRTLQPPFAIHRKKHGAEARRMIGLEKQSPGTGQP